MSIALILCSLLACETKTKSDAETEDTLLENMVSFSFPATAEELTVDFTNDVDLAVKKFDGSKIVLSGIVESTQDEKENDCPHIILSGGEKSAYKIKICLENNLLPSDTIQAGKHINMTVKYLTHSSNIVLLEQTN